MRWTTKELSAKSGVSLPTIHRMESAIGIPKGRIETIQKIENAHYPSTSEGGAIRDFLPGTVTGMESWGVGPNMDWKRDQAYSSLYYTRVQ